MCSADEDHCRHLDFKAKETFDGKRLVNHVIRIAEVTVKKFCEAECFMEPYCVSFNLDKRTDGNEKLLMRDTKTTGKKMKIFFMLLPR